MLRARWGVLVATCAFACGPGYTKLDVDKIQTVAVGVDDPDQTFCAYKPVALRAHVTYDDGKQAASKLPGERQKGKLRTSEFEWSASTGAVDGEAVFALPRGPLAWFDQPIRVSARVIARPEMVGESELRPRFDCGGTVDVRGAAGARGGEGEDGGPGEVGPAVEVALAYIDSQRHGRLVLVRVRRGDDEPEHFVVDTRNTTTRLVIDASGGDGGRGGQGFTGVAGLAGIDGEGGVEGVGCADGGPGQNGTDGGPGGPGGAAGNGGDGARGGNVTVRYDARYPDLPDQIDIFVAGGKAGDPGRGGGGGAGGAAGKGGVGGKAGADTGAGASECPAVDGPAGVDGVAGEHGPRGPDGQPGVAGAAGEIRREAADATQLFADELAGGVALATASAEGAR